MVCKRLAAVGRARSFVDWLAIKPLAADLGIQRAAIVGAIAMLAKPSAKAPAERSFKALLANDYG